MPVRIGDDVRRGLRPQPKRALRVAAAWGHLPRCASQLAPRRSQRGLREYSDGLLGKIGLPVVVALCLTGCAQPSDPASSSGPPPPPPAETDIGPDVSRMADQFLSVQEMDPFLHGLTEEEAYPRQEAFVERLSATLGGVAGYKTGGHDTRPPNPNFPTGGIRAVLLEGMVKPSGTAVSLDDSVWGFLEADFAFRVGDVSINTADTDLEILAGLDAIVPFLEIPDPAFTGNRRSQTSSIVTNMASRYAFVGDPVPLAATPDWIDRIDAMTFAVHDEQGTEVGSGRLDGHYEPLRVVRWLRDHLRASGIRLEPGHLLSLGNLDITRQLKPDSPQGGPAYRSNRFTLSYYGLSDDPATVTVNIDR